MLNKTKFLELVRNPELIQENDLPKLDELATEHPYSQIIHVLKVKGRCAFDKPDLQESLHRASTYIYDRSILRSLIEGSSTDEQSSVAPESNQPENKPVKEETSDFSWINQDEDDEDIFIDEIPEEEEVETSIPELGSEVEAPDPSKSFGEQESKAVLEPAEEQQPVDSSDSTEEDPQDLQPSVPPPPPPAEATAQTSPESQDKVTEPQKNPLDLEIEAGSIHAELMMNLNQLQESKQQFEEPTEKNGGPQNLQEQIEIIDNFIKNSPVLSKPNLNAESEGVSQDDLSKASTKFSEEMVSENLAKIYLKQGKAKDAEKIYKRLIRKFPQKKPYFADQIEKIKRR